MHGAFDTKLQGYSFAEPSGFYRNYRQGIGLARQTWWGGYVSAGYRIGRGDFAPWYKEREADKSGEYNLGAAFPLLQGRAIDAQRVAVFQASVDRRLAEPILRQSILDTSLEAARVNWQWVTQAESALRSAVDTLDRYRFAFTQGYVDLIYLNLLETKANESEIKLIEAQENWFDWLAAYQAALGLDPLDQALIIGRLPISETPGPGNLPKPSMLPADQLKKDWQRKES